MNSPSVNVTSPGSYSKNFTICFKKKKETKKQLKMWPAGENQDNLI